MTLTMRTYVVVVPATDIFATLSAATPLGAVVARSRRLAQAAACEPAPA